MTFSAFNIKKMQPFSKGLLLLTVILMDVLAGMEFDLFVPGFPEIQEHFQLSTFWLEALLSVNFIGYCISLFVVGAVADRYGRKPVIIIGLVIFIMGSVLCLWDSSYPFMLLGRFLQGIGAAAPAILSFLIIADIYPLKEQQSLFATLNGIMNISVGIAPVIGSYVALYFHWQGNFTVILILGIIVLGMTQFFIPKTTINPQKIDLIKGYTDVLRSKPLMLLILHMVVLSVPYWIFVGMAPVLYMKNFGVSLSHFGYYQGSLAFLFALGTIGYGFIMNRLEHRRMLYISAFIMILSFFGIGIVTLRNISDPLIITLSMLPLIVGQIIPVTILYPLCLNFLPQAKGRASALLQGTRLILTAAFLQLTSHLYDGTFYHMGIMISAFVLLSIITLFLVMQRREISPALDQSD